MRPGIVVVVVALWLTCSLVGDASAQETSARMPEPQIAVLDQSAAELLAPYLAGVSIAVLLEGSDELPNEIDSRALSLRDAKFLVFRGDQLSLLARMYCERLQNQGVRLVDLNDVGIPRARGTGARHGVFPRQRAQPEAIPAELEARLAADFSTDGSNR